MEKGKHHFKSVYTFKLIPNDEGMVKTFRCPKYAVKTMALFVVILFAGACFFISSYMTTRIKYKQNAEDIALLKEVNQEQKSQIDELKDYAQNIQDKVNSLTALETKVKDLVGLPESKEAKEENEQHPSASMIYQDQEDKEQASRGGFFSRGNRTSQYDQSKDLKEIEATLKNIDSSLAKGEDDLNNLKEDVIHQLDYLEAKPDLWPNNGRITSPFGNRRAPTGGASTFHKGIDIANSYGSPIVAAGSGKVTFSGWKSGTGRTVILSHGYGYKTLYAHNSSLLVKEGQEVKKGQPIAKLGNTGISTGPHVHFEVHIDGNPVDPLTVLK